MMIDANKTYSRTSLRSDIYDKFGVDATFYTCSASGMSADELIKFLENKGKVVFNSYGYIAEEVVMCNH